MNIRNKRLTLGLLALVMCALALITSGSTQAIDVDHIFPLDDNLPRGYVRIIKPGVEARGLETFQLGFVGGNKHIQELSILRNMNAAELNFRGEGLARYTYELQYRDLRDHHTSFTTQNSPEYFCDGVPTCTQYFNVNETHGRTFVLSGFRFESNRSKLDNHRAHHIRRIGIQPVDRGVSATFEDNTPGNDHYHWMYQYSWVPNQYISDTNVMTFDTRAGDTHDIHNRLCKRRQTGVAVLQGFEFAFENSDHPIRDIGVDLRHNQVCIIFKDDNIDDPITGTVWYAMLDTDALDETPTLPTAEETLEFYFKWHCFQGNFCVSGNHIHEIFSTVPANATVRFINSDSDFSSCSVNSNREVTCSSPRYSLGSSWSALLEIEHSEDLISLDIQSTNPLGGQGIVTYNIKEPADMNGDGFVTPADAIAVANNVSEPESNKSQYTALDGVAYPVNQDVNFDDRVNEADIQYILNQIGNTVD